MKKLSIGFKMSILFISPAGFIDTLVIEFPIVPAFIDASGYEIFFEKKRNIHLRHF